MICVKMNKAGKNKKLIIIGAVIIGILFVSIKYMEMTEFQACIDKKNKDTSLEVYVDSVLSIYFTDTTTYEEATSYINSVNVRIYTDDWSLRKRFTVVLPKNSLFFWICKFEQNKIIEKTELIERTFAS